jgi:hypothetical protein
MSLESSTRRGTRLIGAIVTLMACLALAAPQAAGQTSGPPNGEVILASHGVLNQSGVIQLSLVALSPESGAESVLIPPDERFDDMHGVLSPDGTRIVFVRQKRSREGPPDPDDLDIWIAGVDGSTQINLTATAPTTLEAWPHFSPDGTRIVLEAFPGTAGSQSDIYVMGADGSDPVNLTAGQPHAGFPSFSPDGTRIVYSRYEEGDMSDSDIWVMNADGSDSVNLTNTDALEENVPTFSPDGRIAFHSLQRGDGSTFPHLDIEIMNPDGSSRTNLTQDAQMSDYAPTFSPDGTRIVFVRESNSPFARPREVSVTLMSSDGSGRDTLTSTSSGGGYLTLDWGFLSPPPTGGTCARSSLTVAGTSAGEALPGTSLPDVMAGLLGSDTLVGGGSGDRICGGDGDDTIVGEAEGIPHVESLVPAHGRDVLRGGPGADLLLGGPGRDVLAGGPGPDVCNGGPGRDRKKSCR